ncbi:MAG: hypothetical protein R8L07_07185 [Alphaproteobacteria bacterium]|nr:hypothetical protein [Alphaproteobacteria bacterium]
MTLASGTGARAGCRSENASRAMTCGWADSLFLLRGRRLSRRQAANGTMEVVAAC